MILLQLFAEFFKIGLFAVGGGLATLPFLSELALRTGWFSLEDIAMMLAVSESTPGAIGVNMATYTGFNVARIPGGLCATFGLVLPSIIVIIIIARILNTFKESAIVKAIFSGLRPAATGLIAAAGVGVLRIALIRKSAAPWFQWIHWQGVILFAVLAVLMFTVKKIHPVCYIAIAALVGIILQW